MMTLMVSLLLSIAWADEPIEMAPETTSPVEASSFTPKWSHNGSSWQTPLPSGGFIRTIYADSKTEAEELFHFQSQSAVSVELPQITLQGFEQALGDGQGLLLVRSGTAVILVRDHGLSAQKWLTAVQPLVLDLAAQRVRQKGE